MPMNRSQREILAVLSKAAQLWRVYLPMSNAGHAVHRHARELDGGYDLNRQGVQTLFGLPITFTNDDDA